MVLGAVLGESLDAVAHAVDSFDPATVSGADARLLAELFARGEKLCAAGKMLAAKRVADCSTWTGGGARSPEEWLAGLSGSSVGSASAALDTADRLAEQPALTEALKTGGVSMAQAGEISQAAKAAAESDPEAERRLVGATRAGASMRSLKEQCRRVANASSSREDDEARRQRLRRQRYFRTWVDSDGSGQGRFSMAPGDYARFVALFKPFHDDVFDTARTEGRQESYQAYGADALLALAEAAHSSSAPGSASSPGPVKVPATIIALIDLAALRRGSVGTDETCEIVGVGSVPVSVVEEFLGDAFFAAAIVDGRDIRRVVHLGRHATALQRTALWVRDRACVHCGSLHHLEIDHVDEWSATQRTQLDRLAFLCRGCHHLKTHRGWKLIGAPGHYRLRAPDP
jgi:hypothetical protein